MAESRKKIVVVAVSAKTNDASHDTAYLVDTIFWTPTSPILSHLIHSLSQNASLQITVLTRQTSVNILRSNGQSHDHVHDHDNDHCHNYQHDHADLTHVQIDFSEFELEIHLSKTNTVICVFTGSDMHLTHSIIDAAAKAGVKLFIPSEYSLDTANPRNRELLPPSQVRFEIQQKLKGFVE